MPPDLFPPPDLVNKIGNGFHNMGLLVNAKTARF